MFILSHYLSSAVFSSPASINISHQVLQVEPATSGLQNLFILLFIIFYFTDTCIFPSCRVPAIQSYPALLHRNSLDTGPSEETTPCDVLIAHTPCELSGVRVHWVPSTSQQQWNRWQNRLTLWGDCCWYPKPADFSRIWCFLEYHQYLQNQNIIRLLTWHSMWHNKKQVL